MSSEQGQLEEAPGLGTRTCTSFSGPAPNCPAPLARGWVVPGLRGLGKVRAVRCPGAHGVSHALLRASLPTPPLSPAPGLAQNISRVNGHPRSLLRSWTRRESRSHRRSARSGDRTRGRLASARGPLLILKTERASAPLVTLECCPPPRPQADRWDVQSRLCLPAHLSVLCKVTA